MQQRLSLVTLGVADLARARRFYGRGLGWRESGASTAEVAFYDAGGVALALFSRAALAADAGVSGAGTGFGGVALAHNVRSPAEADAVLEEARAAGGTITRPGGATFWGGYSGAFTDPDGHPWEVAHNPFWTLADDGSIRIGSS